MSSDLAGRQFGPYRVLEPLGSGGMGSIWRGERSEDSSPVAVKVLLPHVAKEGRLLPRFIREAEAYRKLDHPNIVRYIGSGCQEGTYFLVLEFVEGDTLESLQKRMDGPLGVRRAVLVARDLLEALVHAHGQKIIHRDIKPHNIMISRHGEVKLLDFGAAATEDRLVETGAGTVLGSFLYAAPEQNQGQQADERSDLYALGLVLWEMLTGERALKGESLMAITSNQISEGIPPPSSMVLGVPSVLDVLCRQLLRARRTDRLETAEEALTMLVDSGLAD
jgi:serine/threonine-protein kinase